jgi:7,8-dihydro-6-hydroxymethylpterin-pyrophosphokinase
MHTKNELLWKIAAEKYETDPYKDESDEAFMERMKQEDEIERELQEKRLYDELEELEQRWKQEEIENNTDRETS